MRKKQRSWSRREFLKKTAGAATVLSLTPLAKLRSSYAQSSTKSRAIVAQGVGIFSLNPYATTTSPLQGPWECVMESLIAADYDRRSYKGALAESWTVKGNKLQFKLRKGIKFHDGSPFTSKDVMASYKRIVTDKQSLQASNLEPIAEIEASDDLNLTLTLKKPNATIFEGLLNRNIMKQAVAEKMGAADKPPIGTGPYKFVSWERGTQFVIRRNEDYWGPQPRIEEIVYKAIQEDAARIAALEAGQVDLITYVPPHEVQRLRSNPRLRVQQVQGLRPIFLVLSPAYKPLDHPLVRRAISQAIDSEALIKYILEGSAYPLAGFLSPQVFGYDPGARAYPYDPAKVKQLLAEAGLRNGFEIEYYNPTGRYPKDREVALAIVDQLSKVGIKAILKTPEWSIFSTEYKEGKYPFYLTGRGSLVDADSLFRQYFRTGVTKRVLGYSNPKLDEILDIEQQTFDVKKREKLLWEAQRIILEDAPAIPLWNSMDIYAHKADLVWTAPPDEKVSLSSAYFR